MTSRLLLWPTASLLVGAAGLYLAFSLGAITIPLALTWVAAAARSGWKGMPDGSPATRVMAGAGLGLLALLFMIAGFYGLLAWFSASCDPGQYECPI